MICACPKCTARNEVDLAEIPEGGTSTNCTACKARFLITRESIAHRAYRKAEDAHCAKCGNDLGSSLHCPSCGELYPDYFVAEAPDVARKQARKIVEAFSSLKDLSFEWGAKPKSVPRYTSRAKSVTPVSREKSRKFAMVVSGLMLLVVAVASGGWFYMQNKAQQQYAENYIKALYGVKSGMEYGLKACSKISEEMKSRGNARISPEDEIKMGKVKDEVDKIMQKLKDPPGKFGQANEKLTKLYEIYKSVYILAISPTGSSARISGVASKAESEFRQGTQELKSSLPEELSEALKKGKNKYRGLRDL